jgi:hypothetical protein
MLAPSQSSFLRGQYVCDLFELGRPPLLRPSFLLPPCDFTLERGALCRETRVLFGEAVMVELVGEFEVEKLAYFDLESLPIECRASYHLQSRQGAAHANQPRSILHCRSRCFGESNRLRGAGEPDDGSTSAKQAPQSIATRRE